MADYDSSLPIRSEADGTDERVHVKLVDYTDPSGTDKQLEISEKKAHVRNFSKDSDGVDQQVLLSQEGHTQSNGKYDASLNKRPSSQGLIASDRDAAPSEATMNKRPTAIAGNDDKIALDVAISDSFGNRFDQNNPLPVYQTVDPGDEIENYNQAVNIAKDASANHDYTVTAGKEFRGLNVIASSSAKAKFELQVETGPGAGTFATIGVQFNSTANPNVTFALAKPKAIAAGVIIRLIKTNLDNSAVDLYSAINGIEV